MDVIFPGFQHWLEQSMDLVIVSVVVIVVWVGVWRARKHRRLYDGW